jgi:uncharacterized protein YbjT (DUF2867 family)
MQDHRYDRPRRVLVTGATGNVGRHVVSELRGRGIGVRALTRSPRPAGLPEDVEVVVGDLAAPETFAAELDGVDAAFLVWPFFDVNALPAVLDTLGRHAKRLVYLSAAGVPDDPTERSDLFHAAVERAVARSAMEWTFLRPTGFATNTLMWAPQIRGGDVVRWPFGRAARSLIHERDIAAVAARALVDGGHAGARYVLTGPETLTSLEQVRIIGEALGRPVRFEELSPEEAREQLLQAWGNATFVDAALSGWAKMVDRPEGVTHTVEEITGAPARTFRQWAQEHVADFGGERAS